MTPLASGRIVAGQLVEFHAYTVRTCKTCGETGGHKLNCKRWIPATKGA